MKVGEVFQYELEVPHFKHCFSFKIYHTQLYLPLLDKCLGNILSHLPPFKEKYLQQLFYNKTKKRFS